MRRPLCLALAAIILCVQWSLSLHVYQPHHHDKGRVCALCAVADLHHHAPPSAPSALPPIPGFSSDLPPLARAATVSPCVTPYRVRAPPLV